MGLLNLLPTSIFGYKGLKPDFDGETPSSTLHDQSSINNHPAITKNSSHLDEDDSFNTSKYRSTPNNRYIDNLPR